jgi:hypothetical protein
MNGLCINFDIFNGCEGCVKRALASLSSSWPELDWRLNLTPVDVAASVAVDIPSCAHGVLYHLIHPQSINVEEIVTLLNVEDHRNRMISYEDWKSMISGSRSSKVPHFFVSLSAHTILYTFSFHTREFAFPTTRGQSG